MKLFLKKHMGLIVLLVLILAFPASLSTQARLNMRVMITGLAIDKTESGYELTAQIIKTTPNTESSGTGATVNFVSEKADDVLSLLAKISYKTGKIAGFSHINFLIVGKDMLEENLTQALDYFVRDGIIKDSILLLYSNGTAKDEIKKTKDMELSVGVELQKVFLYKEKESDGKMTSLLNFMKDSWSYSKTAVVSCLSLKNESDEQNQTEQSGQGGSSQSSSNQSSQSSSSESKYNYFESFSPLACFVSGKYVGVFEEESEIIGYMMTQKQAITDEIVLDNINVGELKNATIGIKIKNKSRKIKVRYEDNQPVVDVSIDIINSEIRDVKNNNITSIFSQEEYQTIKKEIEKNIAQKVASVFEKSKEMEADIFCAYELAVKYNYNKTKNNFNSMEEFLDNLKLNVNVKVSRLEY